MSSSATRYGLLVAGVDGSNESDCAIRFAVREAVMRDAPLTLMHCPRCDSELDTR